MKDRLSFNDGKYFIIFFITKGFILTILGAVLTYH